MSRLSCSDWIELARLFEDERSATEIARTVGRAYATVYHAVTVMRASIFAHDCASNIVSQNDPQTLLRVCAHRGQKAFQLDGHVPVFGIHEFGGAVAVPPLPDLSPQIVLALPVKKVRRGRLVYTGQVEDFDALMFCVSDEFEGLSRVPFARSPTYIDGASRFWAYASPRLAAHRGVSPEHFPLYLKELEFRFNLRGEVLMPLLLRYLCDFVPSVAPEAELSKQTRLDEPIRQSPGGSDHV